MLELLWHCAEQFHDDGGVGRWSDANIAGAMDWHGGDARQLICTLVAVGWLDEVKNDPVRLVVHDWLSHAANHVWSRVKKRVERALDRKDNVPPWLLQQYEKGKVERNKDQAEGGGYGGDESLPARPGRTRNRDPDEEKPDAGTPVRLRPAASDPNPRPKTQDQPSDPRSDGEGVAAAIAARPPATAETVLEFLCLGQQGAWSLTQEHLNRLVLQWPSVRVYDCLASLAQRQIDEVGLRRTARGMPAYLQNWLRLEVERYRKFTHANEAAGKRAEPFQSSQERVRKLLETT